MNTPANRANVLINYNESSWSFASYENGVYKTQSGAIIQPRKVKKFYYISQVVEAIKEQEAIKLGLN